MMTRSTIRPDSSGMVSAMVLLTQNSMIEPMIFGKSGLQYGSTQRRLPALVFLFGSTYMEPALLLLSTGFVHL